MGAHSVSPRHCGWLSRARSTWLKGNDSKSRSFPAMSHVAPPEPETEMLIEAKRQYAQAGWAKDDVWKAYESSVPLVVILPGERSQVREISATSFDAAAGELVVVCDSHDRDESDVDVMDKVLRISTSGVVSPFLSIVPAESHCPDRHAESYDRCPSLAHEGHILLLQADDLLLLNPSGDHRRIPGTCCRCALADSGHVLLATEGGLVHRTTEQLNFAGRGGDLLELGLLWLLGLRGLAKPAGNQNECPTHSKPPVGSPRKPFEF